MEKIRMVDLRRQYLRIKEEIDDAIHKVVDSTAFINGPEVGVFAKELENYLGVRHVIPCGNGTDALQLALMALDLQPGDEVITSDFTFIATVETIALLGLKPVLADVDPHHFNITAETIEKNITPKTKAIVPVHLFGQCAPMEDILALARKYNLFVIEDTAQATGARYIFKNNRQQSAGTLGDIGCTSFFPSKNLGGYGDGGALLTNHDELAQKLKYLVNHGMKKRYHHDYIGVNSRLDSIQAAILSIKLKYLDTYNQARQNAAEFYNNALGNLEGISVPSKVSWSQHIYHQYTLQCHNYNRDQIREELEKFSIPSMIYYPIPLHKQKAFASFHYNETNFPNSSTLCKKVLSLPMHTELDQEQLNYITDRLINVISTSHHK